MDLEKKYPWSFLGAAITIIGVLFSLIYSDKFISKEVEFKALNYFDVYRLGNTSSKLKIKFNGIELDSDKNIKLLQFKFQNGKQRINKEDFYVNEPIGLIFQNGTILDDKINIVDSNPLQLKEYVSIETDSLQNTVKLSPFHLDEDEYIIFDLLLSVSKNEQFTVKPLGRILGIDEISLSKEFDAREIELEYHRQQNYRSSLLIILISLPIIYSLYRIYKNIERKDNKEKEKSINLITNIMGGDIPEHFVEFSIQSLRGDLNTFQNTVSLLRNNQELEIVKEKPISLDNIKLTYKYGIDGLFPKWIYMDILEKSKPYISNENLMFLEKLNNAVIELRINELTSMQLPISD